MALKRFRRKAVLEKDQERVDLIDSVLDDPDLEDLVHEASYEEYAYRIGEKEIVEAYGQGAFIKFLKWLVDHREEIFKFILTIIQLLSVLQPKKEFPSVSGK